MERQSDPNSPDSYYRNAIATLGNAADEENIAQTDYELITEFLSAYNEDDMTVPKPNDEKYRKKRTLASWAHRLHSTAKRIDGTLVDADADTVNQLWQDCIEGSHPDVKDEGLAKNTVSSSQSTARMFYEYHDDLDVSKDDLTVTAPEKNNVTEDEIFTLEEVYDMREAAQHPRNRCLFDLLAFTGQRLRAVQTLRVGDIDLDNGTFQLNEDDGGLKYAEGKRPLLLAEASVREWINDHPNPEDGAYLICARPSYNADVDGSSPISQKTIRRTMDKIADRADVDKPANPHNFRHASVTVWKREYDLDDMTIKGLIGHRQGSRVMEETYAHLTDEDHINAAQKATDTGNGDEKDAPTTPEICPACGEPLRPGAVACAMCGLDISPQSKNAKDLAREAVHESAKDAVTEAEKAEVDEVKRVVEENPELIAQALDTEALQEALGGDD